jgi:hypothetical protein
MCSLKYILILEFFLVQPFLRHLALQFIARLAKIKKMKLKGLKIS